MYRPEKGFFNEFERQFEEMNKIINNMMQSDKPQVYGISVQVGPDGVPHIEHFGNVRPTWQRPQQDIREPFTSTMVDEKNNEFNITAEMPGIGKEDIEVDATENEVFIKAEGNERKYYKNVRTPAPVDTEIAKAKYNNGVLEVTFKLKEPHVAKGKKIKIE